MSARRAGVYTVAAGTPFLDVLAGALIDGTFAPADGAPAGAPDTIALAATTVYLPTRRAGRALAGALHRVAGRGVLLPAIRGLGEIGEEDDSAAFHAAGGGEEEVGGGTVSDAERRMVLADIAMDWAASTTKWVDRAPVIGPQPVPRTPAEATAFAIELALLFDEMIAAGASRDRLARVVPEDMSELARNWEINLEFLTHALESWTAYLTARGLADRVARRDRRLRAAAETLMQGGSPAPVIAAGSTGSVAAAQALMRAIASQPNGAVVLPGLDTGLDDRGWREIGPDHPQFGMKRLIEAVGIERADVQILGAPSTRGHAIRNRLVGEIMRPAAAADLWVEAISRFDAGEVRAALKTTSLIEADDEHEEARMIALMLRRAIDDPDRLTALVTPDRVLARRVAGELARWNVAIDDSAGQPLASSVPGVFMRLIAEVASTRFAPVATLSLLKHPLTRLGRDPADVRRAARTIEIAALRGARPGEGIAGLETALFEAEAAQRPHPVAARLDSNAFAEARELLASLAAAFMPLARIYGGAAERSDTAASALITAHVETAEALARIPAGEPHQLWAGAAGEALAAFLAEAIAGAGHARALPPADYGGWIDQIMRGRVVRTPRSGPGNVVIWGPLEARLQPIDRLILAGLNEGAWPAETETDPWLGRHMREALGLEPPERRIGLQAHDVAQGLLAEEVVLTRARKSGGTPAVPSRWLWRLGMLLEGIRDGDRDCTDALDPAEPWIAWARSLDAAPLGEPLAPPRPAPPVSARPKRLSVTRIETLIRDPYAIYAREVLGLQPLDALELAPDAADYGQLIHGALGRLIEEHPAAPLPDGALARLIEIGREEFSALDDRPGLRAYWWLRFERIARWFIDHDRHARAPGTHSHTEIGGRMELAVPGLENPFALSARADRIDIGEAGDAVIVDYKTGRAPSDKQIRQMLAPQLPLEAAMLRAGAFGDVGARPVAALVHLSLSGREPPGEEKVAPDAPDLLADDAMDRLSGLLAAYADPARPYLSRIAPLREEYVGDYDHLARVGEWSVGVGRRHDR